MHIMIYALNSCIYMGENKFIYFFSLLRRLFNQMMGHDSEPKAYIHTHVYTLLCRAGRHLTHKYYN